MDDSEPTFSTEPSSSAMRARAFTCVFTRSCQSMAVFAAALMVFPPRAMLTAGITRETSPARCPAACGAAQTSPGVAIRNESNNASPKVYGDFVFIEDSPNLAVCIYRSDWGTSPVNAKQGAYAYSLYALVGTRLWRRSIAKMKQRRCHVIMLLPPAGKVFDSGEDLAQELSGRRAPVGFAKLLQPFDSELIPFVIECIRHPIRAEEHGIARLQAQG